MSFTIIAIDRAESQFGDAVKIFRDSQSDEVRAFMLVNEQFKASPAYRGDENNGMFTEIVCNFQDTPGLKAILADICQGTTVMHCRMEESIKDYALVIPLLPKGTVVPDIESLAVSNEKFKMRRAMQATHPEIAPKFTSIENSNELTAELLKGFTFPVIIKPNALHSSFFVTKCEDFNQAKQAVELTFKELQRVYDRDYGTGTPSLVIEEFMTGTMYSCDVYIQSKGVLTYLPPVRVIVAAEIGLEGYYGYQRDTYTGLSPRQISDMNTCCAKAIDALQLTHSVAHVELYLTADGWKIIEVGPRIGGNRQELYYEAFGIQHYLNDLLIHAGMDPITKHLWERFSSGLAMYSGTEGVVQSIKGATILANNPHIVKSSLAKIGDPARRCSNGGVALAIIITSADSKEQLSTVNQSVRDNLVFEIGTPLGASS
jgi:ATP-grasp domain